MQDVKPCACGNTMCGIAHMNFLGEMMYYVSCLLCGKAGPYSVTQEDAVILWNNLRVLEGDEEQCTQEKK